MLEPEFLHHSRGKLSSLCRPKQVLEDAPGMDDLLVREAPATDCLCELIFVENHISPIRSDPEIEEEVDDRLERGWIRALPSHGF